MAYIKNTWFDQNVEKPKTYNVIQNADSSVTLVDSFGQITELGTPVNAENMNHIEDGVAGVAIRLFSMTEIFALDEWVKDGEKLYKSLQDQNQGHATSEAEFWEEVKFGTPQEILDLKLNTDLGNILYNQTSRINFNRFLTIDYENVTVLSSNQEIKPNENCIGILKNNSGSPNNGAVLKYKKTDGSSYIIAINNNNSQNSAFHTSAVPVFLNKGDTYLLEIVGLGTMTICNYKEGI